MSESEERTPGGPDLARSLELSQLVDLEASWENLRGRQVLTRDALSSKQKAYDTFHSRLVTYNRKYTPVHVPELLLNTPARLSKWCHAMRDLFRRVESDARAQCPVHVVEKAYRRVETIAQRLGRSALPLPAPPATIAEALRELDTVIGWCAELEKEAA